MDEPCTTQSAAVVARAEPIVAQRPCSRSVDCAATKHTITGLTKSIALDGRG